MTRNYEEVGWTDLKNLHLIVICLHISKGDFS